MDVKVVDFTKPGLHWLRSIRLKAGLQATLAKFIDWREVDGFFSGKTSDDTFWK